MKTSTQLKNKASELLAQCPEYEAVELLKAAGMEEDQARFEVAQHLMEKEAASTIAATGIDYDEAMKMVKAAGIKVAELQSFKQEPSLEESLAKELLKVASEVEALEDKAAHAESLFEKVAELEETLAQIPETTTVPEEITKLAQSGDFSNADLEALLKLPSETLTKVANAGHQEQPWRMGKAAGMSKESVDPLLEFLIG